MQTRKKQLSELFGTFQMMRRNMASPRMFQSVPQVTASQWGVLAVIEAQNGNTVGNIAKQLGITSSASTQLIDGLIKKGYVVGKRNVRDRRTVTIHLSSRMKRQIASMKKEAFKQLFTVFDALNNKELETYLMLNKKILRRYEKDNVIV